MLTRLFVPMLAGGACASGWWMIKAGATSTFIVAGTFFITIVIGLSLIVAAIIDYTIDD